MGTSELDASSFTPPTPSCLVYLSQFVLDVQMSRLSLCDISDWLKVTHFIVAKQVLSLALLSPGLLVPFISKYLPLACPSFCRESKYNGLPLQNARIF